MFNLFKSNEEKARMCHIKNLLMVAMADGKIVENEKLAIAAICTREGITPNELETVMKSKVKFVAPKDEDTKLKHLSDLVTLMMCDGDIDDKEYAICKWVAEKYGYRHEIIDAVINKIIEELKKDK